MRSQVQFYLNDHLVRVDAPRADTTLLAYIRETARLTGTKEGCNEGDCGACTVLVGRLVQGKLCYQSLNACIAFLAQLDGTHIVTVEALSKSGVLHWVPRALADYHGTQCGFCTPGIVMSLYAMWMETAAPRRTDVETALQGNLCRCTGYLSIIRGITARAAEFDVANDPLLRHRRAMIAKLGELAELSELAVDGEAGFAMPRSIDAALAYLDANPTARIVAGATDVGLWVTKGLRRIDPVLFLNQIDELKRIERHSDRLIIGAVASLDAIARVTRQVLPMLDGFWDVFAGQQVRNTGTMGGNVANGSPIGDTPPVLIALDAMLVLRSVRGERRIKAEDYFIAYGQQDRAEGELLTAIEIPLPIAGEFGVYKISKRKHEDISTTLAAIRVVREGDRIRDARIAFGGMAATPKRARAAEAALIGAEFAETSFRAAMAALNTDFTPLSDMRASSEYRMVVSQNLLLKYYLERSGIEA